MPTREVQAEGSEDHDHVKNVSRCLIMPGYVSISMYVPGSESPAHPPAMVMVKAHQRPLSPVEWMGPVGRGEGHPTSNQQQCNW